MASPEPLLEAALDLVRGTPEGRALRRKLDYFDRLGDKAKERAAPEIREDLADIVARAVTEAHLHDEVQRALATYRNDPAPAEAEPHVTRLVGVAEAVLAELGKDMLIEVLLPGAHLFLPPTDFLDSLLTAVTMARIAGPADWD